ncbi:MAG: 30S ribosomal protein S2 [Elusimicrobia bacterium RIFCSPLOWO2_02_FULL_39_32]|nr:MAG: 30S ribosomal protein S2 [Elusimicrobia bacterium GWA2_38_7]OGR81302.1 MAG: 30S ribosomal protein S2 [Elusimicrobia bacterium RIFCSPHIGHO2_02_FULL_39_36]OGR91415.1 MAG: 30S ribosomal protein S2 [Elusimicrobia bacterium RIFCSPLOWO2_02_FULL_39_32]OGR98530.1 MAG: 30S ribosomal protein S2 [Elusimicrobia bacterium RIFCSPLOWO2_12_FULL_39_28]
MSNISMKSLLEAGVHFGHQTRVWNPKMAKYIYGSRNNIHIIDLSKTVKELKKALKFLKESAQESKVCLFVGTTKQSQEAIKEASIRSGSPYVNERWLGGTLTNFTTIQKSIERLKELERMKEEKILDVLSKKENSRLAKTKFRLEKSLSGIKDMGELPSILFVIDPMSEITAIMEARKLEIPIVAVCDTNCNPDLIDYPIPGNDDAVRSIKLFCNYAADAILEGRQIAQKIEADENGGQPEKYPEIPASEGLEKLEENPQSPQVNVPENSSAVETKGAL